MESFMEQTNVILRVVWLFVHGICRRIAGSGSVTSTVTACGRTFPPDDDK